MIATRHKLITAMLTAVLCTAAGIRVYAADKPVMPNGYVRVINPKIPITIPDAYLEFDVGDRLELFQENKDYFIALANISGQGKTLCAFTAKKGRGKVAWVTPEKDMFFGYQTPSCSGKLYLKRNEKLRVLDQDASGYDVVIERFGREATLWIPTNSTAYTYVPPPPPKPKALPTHPPSTPSVTKKKSTKWIRKTEKIAAPRKIIPKKTGESEKLITTNKPHIKKLKPRQVVKEVFAPTSTPEKIISPSVIKPATPQSEPQPQPVLKSTPAESEVKSEPKSKPALVIQPEPESVEEPAEKSEEVSTPVTPEPSAEIEPEKQIIPKQPPEQKPQIPVTQKELNKETADGESEKKTEDLKEEPKTTRVIQEEKKIPERISKPVEIFKIEGPIPGEKGWEELQKETEEAHWIIRIAITEFILLALLIFLLVHREAKGRRERTKLITQLNEQAREQVQPFIKATSTHHDEQVTLSGVVGPMTICMIAQFLYAERETGRLTVSGKVVDNIGALAFLNGHIVDAAYNDIAGEDAVYKILALGEGEFMFIQGSLKGFTKTCDCDTMGLLLNAHRMMDEQHASEKLKEPENPAGEIKPTPPAND